MLIPSIVVLFLVENYKIYLSHVFLTPQCKNKFKIYAQKEELSQDTQP